MCGIAGIVHADRSRPIDRALIERMGQVIAHRGPDAGTFHFGGGIALASRRLAIIDVAGGDQPLYNEDRSLAVVLNGEIYNFRELRTELESRGHRFRTRSDTEAIVHAYEEYGLDCVAKLRGMFGFALWDERRRRLLIARDRVGKKPLYYTDDTERFAFASELKALLQDPARKRAVNLEAVDGYLSFGCVPGPRTILEGVRQLPPAHYLVWQAGAVTLTEYWDVPREPASIVDEREALERFDEVFTEAVRIRLVSDVPLGAFLSGGVDSSAVVTARAKLSAGPVVTTSVGFADPRFSELRYARQVAEAVKSEHHEVMVAPQAAAILPRLVWHLDEPFADSSALPTFYLSAAARQRVTVALSGDGGDEIFAGYQRRYGVNRWEARWRRALPPGLRAGVLAPLGRVYPQAAWLPRPLRGRCFLQNVGTTFERAYFNDLSFFREPDKASLVAPDFVEHVAGYDPFTDFVRHFDRVADRDRLEQLLYVDLKTWLVNDILVKVDRMSMANSLEVRSPLLDHKVIEFAATVAPSLKYRGRTSKYLLKRYVERSLPRSLIYRQKQGFEIPLASWLRTDLRDLGEELLLSSRARSRGYVRHEAVRRLWDEHGRGTRDHAPGLWSLLMLELWHRTFVDQDPSLGPLTT